MILLPIVICVVSAIACQVFGSVPPPMGRIYNPKRTLVHIEDAPYMATVRPAFSSHWCGASIINSKYLVSAAHCFERRNAVYDLILWLFPLSIYVGTDDMDKYYGKEYEIEAVFQHPQYKMAESNDYDVAVIKLKEELVFDETVRPVKMVNKDFFVPDGTFVKTMGFGAVDEENASNQLLMVNVPIFNHKKCKRLYESTLDLEITDRMICAGGQYHKDSCKGDSGGPLIFDNQLLGIVSFGGMCGVEGQPGVYSSIPKLRDFIDKIVETTSEE